MTLLQDKLAVLERVISFIMAVKTWKQLFIKFYNYCNIHNMTGFKHKYP